MSKKRNKDSGAQIVQEDGQLLGEELSLVEFEEWFSQREKLIPAHHHREIIRADFLARKVPKLATMDQFDEALRKYGVRLD